MKAVVLKAPETLIYEEDIPLPVPGPGWVRVQIRAASICGSDMLRVYHGAAKVYPLILGHECAGVVEVVGEGVDQSWVNQPVAIAPLIPCMICNACQRGLYASCLQYSFIGSRIAGAFAEYVNVPVGNLVLLPAELNMELGALLEPTTVALHALKRADGVQGKSTAVFGVGSIGMLMAHMARIGGATFVAAVDILPRNLEFARTIGVDEALNATHPDLVTDLKCQTDGGVDVTIETSGSPKALEQAIYACRPGGQVVFVGNQPLNHTFSSSLIEHIMRQQLNLYGVWMSYSTPFPGQEWTDAVNAIQETSDIFRAMITHRFRLVELPQAFVRLHSRQIESQKVIIQP
jgi:threonine dehydrogenase-like Zn-dependent dehydrogenase